MRALAAGLNHRLSRVEIISLVHCGVSSNIYYHISSLSSFPITFGLWLEKWKLDNLLLLFLILQIELDFPLLCAKFF